MYARVTIDMAAIAEEGRLNREIERRMEAGGLSAARREKTRRRVRARRFYVRCLEPELRGLIEDMRERSRLIATFDECRDITPIQWDFLEARRPMRLGTFFYLRAADAADRLETFEQQLQRRRLIAEHQAAESARRFDVWQAIEAQSPYRSEGLH